MQRTDIQIAYIGGGSTSWARTLMSDLALTPELGGEIRLYDIDYARAVANQDRAPEIFDHAESKTSFTVRAVRSVAEALRGADYVIMSILPGPMQMFANDLDIPLRYGIVQTVGDTTGPGGISRSLRSVPIFADYARQVMEHSPDAWVINYTNPMTLCTQAMFAAAPGIKAIGCCHEVFGTRGWVASMVARERGIDSLHRREIDIDLIGLNHFTFFTRASYRGEDVFPIVRAFMERDGYFRDRTADALERNRIGRFGSCDGLIQLDFLRRFGVIGAAGDRHLVEFVPWYIDSEDTLHRWGVSVTTSAARLGTWRPPVGDRESAVGGGAARKPKPVQTGLKRSKEEGVDLMLALSGLRDIDTNVNVPNRGQIDFLPRGHVVETLASVRTDALSPWSATPPPLALQTHLRRIADTQQLTLEAALTCDRDCALQAMLSDPLVRLDTDRASALLEELLAANAAALPGW
ncbi:MAG: alpha-galactosidase [Planctomycetota bacterium]